MSFCSPTKRVLEKRGENSRKTNSISSIRYFSVRWIFAHSSGRAVFAKLVGIFGKAENFSAANEIYRMNGKSMNKSSRVVESPREFAVKVVVREQTEVAFKQFVSFALERILVFGIPSQNSGIIRSICAHPRRLPPKNKSANDFSE